MKPDSLIFLVVLGVWALFFVQHWVRRRDHLATVRTVDQFSAAMRVLERRDPVMANLSAPSAGTAAAHTRPRPLVRRPAPSALRGDADAAAASSAQVPVPAAPGHVDRSGRAPFVLRPSRRVRGLLLLAALAEFLVVAPMVAFGPLSAWVLAPACLAVLWAFAWLRSGVQAEIRARRARAGARPGSARVSSTAGRPATRRTTGLSGSLSAGAAVTTVDAPVETAPARPELHDQDAPVVGEAVAEAATPLAPLLDEDDMPLTWDPIPVPRPTYTMKAMAPQPVAAEPAPATTADAQATPDAGEDPAYPVVRRASGS